jgi:single-strand DNA-binding protein
MANGVNKVIIIGNLGADPEVRYTQSGSPVCNLRVAVGERRKEGDGWREHTEWVSVVCFGKTAENVGQYMSKGKQIYVEGRMQTREYKDKDGNNRKATEVVANQVVFLGGRGGEGGGEGGGGGGGGGGGPRGGGGGGGGRGPVDDGDPGPSDDGGGFYDDDLPF